MVLIHHPSWRTYVQPDALPLPVINDPALPLVSIVTPSYEQGRFIRATIESVLNQDYPNIEYWVIDGGSNDETLAILREYEHDPRLHWMSEPDRGQSDAINKGWRHCRGDIVAWLNSDDIYLPGAIRTQAAALLDRPECGGVYGDALYIDAEGATIAHVYGRPFSLAGLLRLELPIQPTAFLRRDICDRVGPLNLRFRYSMDTEYWLRAAQIAPFRYEPTTIAAYRLHAQSKTIAEARDFHREWLAIALHAFSNPNLPADVASQRKAILADLHSAMANVEARQGDPVRSAALLYAALVLGGPRPRMLKWPPSLIERKLPFTITPLLTQWWSYARSRAQPRRTT